MAANRNALAPMGDTIKAPRRGFSDGGKVDPEQLMRDMQAKYGKGIASAPASPEPEQPAPAPVQPPPKKEGGMLARAMGILGGRKEAIDKAAGYSFGGKIKGPGTPTSDSIPAQVNETGEPIKVSTSERILSAAQDAMLEQIARQMGFESLDAMLEAGTGAPVGPTIKGGIAAAANGANLDEDPTKPSQAWQAVESGVPTVAQTRVNDTAPSAAWQNLATEQAPAVTAKPAYQAPPPSENWNRLTGIAAPTASTTVPAPAKTTQPATQSGVAVKSPTEGGAFANAIGGGIDAVKGVAQIGLGAVRAPFSMVADNTKNALASMLGAQRPNPSGDTDAAMSVIQGGVEDMQSAGRAFGIAKKPIVEAAGWTPINPASAQGQPASQPPSAPAQPAAASSTPAAQPAATTVPLDARGRGVPIGHNAPANPATAVPPGYTVKPTKQEGITRIDGAGKSPIFTNLGAEQAIAGLKGITSGGGNLTNQNPQLDAYGNDMTRTNAMKAQLAELQAQNGNQSGPSVTMLHDSRPEDTQKTLDRWTMEAAAKQMLSQKGGASAAAQLLGGMNDARTKLETTRLQGQNQLENTGLEGRNRLANTALTLSGNPAENALKALQGQVLQQGIDATTQRNADLVKLSDPSIAPEMRKALLDKLYAAQGKNPNEGRYIKLESGYKTDSLGNKESSGEVLFDTTTGQTRGVGGQSGGASAADKIKADMKAGKLTRDEAMKQLQAMGYT